MDNSVHQAIQAGPLGQLPRSIIEDLLVGRSATAAEPGDVLSSPGRIGNPTLVVAGLVHGVVSSAGGRHVTVRYVRPGAVFGLPTAQGLAPVTVRALAPSVVLSFDRERLFGYVRSEPVVAEWVMSEWSRAVNRLVDELAFNIFFPVKARVARHLLDMAAASGDLRLLRARVTQQELADAVGTVREVVTRVLAGLKSDGLVKLGREGIEILKPIELASLAEVS